MIEQLFEVAAEFRFDVGQALINTKALTDGVNDLSRSANSALGALQYLASGLVAHLGLGSGGLLTILSKAVSLSEAMDSSALNFSDNMLANMRVLSGTIDNFNDRLGTSKMILGNISDTAIKFALPTDELAKMSQFLATPLAQHGMLGKNYEGSIEMSKNLMLAAPHAGLNGQAAGESLYRALSDHMPLHGQLFARLSNTNAFKDAHVITQQQLMTMNAQKKITLLNDALKQLAGGSDELQHRLGSISGQFQILKDLVMEIGGVLQPIGDAIKKPLAQVLMAVNQYLQTHGKELSKNIAKIISSVFSDPKGLLINLMQFKRFGGDFKKAMHLTELYGTFKFISYILTEILGISFNGGLIRTVFMGIWEGITALVGLVPWGAVLTGVFTLLSTAAAAVLEVFLPFLFFFQIFSRALAMAKVNDAQNLLEMAPRLAGLLNSLKNAFVKVMMPINMAIDGIAHWIAPLLQTSTWLNIIIGPLEGFADALNALGDDIVDALGGMSGFFNALFYFIDQLVHLHKPTLQGMGDAFRTGYDDFMKANAARIGKDKVDSTSYSVTNIGKVEIRNDFKENQEPDRIAFTLKDQLMKAARNPTQGRGTSLQGAFAR